MCLNLHDYQFKVSRCGYWSTYQKAMETKNQKHNRFIEAKSQGIQA